MTTLKRVSDSDSFATILATVKANADTVVSSINQLSDDYTAIFYEDIKAIEPIKEPPKDYLNRTTYLWLIDTFQLLQKYINKEIKVYNSNGLVSAPDFLDTQLVALWTPVKLETKNYAEEINVDFNQLETALNSLQKGLEPYQN